MDIACDVCGRAVEQPTRGYRLYHTECKALHDDVERIKKHLDRLEAGTHEVKLTTKRAAQLRFDLFCMVSQVPRPRDARGRYVASGVSEEYIRERDARRARKAATG